METLKVNVNVVQLFFNVKDKRGALIPALTKNDFEVLEDGKPQTIKYFTAESNLPLTLGMLIDSSGSQQRVLDMEKEVGSAFLKDIQDMPNQYSYSLQFYNRFYRPEYTTIVLVGDVTREQALGLTKRYFGEWKHGSYVPDIPAEPPQASPRTAVVDWNTPTLPWMEIAFKGPAYSDEKKDKAALDLLSPIAFGPNSELYQTLVLKEQKVDQLENSFGNHPDPELFTSYARIKNPKDVD